MQAAPAHPPFLPENCFARTGVDPLTEAFDDIPARGHGGGAMPAAMRPGASAPAALPAFADFAPAAFSENSDKPFSLYLHTPYCTHRCSFCPFYINAGKPGFSGEYTSLLAREIEDTAALLAPHFGARKVETVFFGGGTPSDIDREDMAEILRRLHDVFPVTAETEITVEGRIRGFSEEKARAWVAAGANRFSLGVQSTDSVLRRRLGRLADRDEIRETLRGLCASGAVVIVDLIYGFPGQSESMLVEDVRFLAEETGIHGLDLYELKQFPGSPLAQAIAGGRLPAAADRAGRGRMYGAAAAKLAEYGFEHFTRKHWRRSARERSLYNRTAQQTTDLVPFGSGAGGRINNAGISLIREINAYTAAVVRGEKPVAHFSLPVPKSPALLFRERLAAHLEACALPAPSDFPVKTRDAVRAVFAQWTLAGLLQNTDSPESGTARALTLAGTFWAEHLQRLLIMLTRSPEESYAA